MIELRTMALDRLVELAARHQYRIGPGRAEDDEVVGCATHSVGC
jgi:hypothetical protein